MVVVVLIGCLAFLVVGGAYGEGRYGTAMCPWGGANRAPPAGPGNDERPAPRGRGMRALCDWTAGSAGREGGGGVLLSAARRSRLRPGRSAPGRRRPLLSP